MMDPMDTPGQMDPSQIPGVPGAPLPPPIDEDAQEELVNKLNSEYDNFKSSVSSLHSSIEKWHSLYETSQKEKKNFPWPDAANFNVPLIMSTVDSIHARITKAVFDVDPLWLTNARTSSAHDTAHVAEKYLDYWADEMGLPIVLDGLIMNMLIEGTGVLKLDWLRKTAQIPQQIDPNTGQSMGGEVIEYDGPGAYHVPLTDFILIPADSPTIDDAVYVGHRVFLNHQQMLARQDQGFYFNVDRLLAKTQGDSVHNRTALPFNLVTVNHSSSKYEETNQYEIVEVYGPYDFGDGPVPALMTFSPAHGVLLRLEPYPYQYGRPPYIDFNVYPRANFFWGRSLPEMLESAQEELTALHNMRADAIAIRIAPPIMRRHGEPWDPEETPWQPAQVIDFTDPAAIFQMQLGDVPSSLFAHEQDTLAFVERVTGMSDYFMGRSPAQNRTATEVNRVTSEGLARMDVMVSRFQQGGMKKLAWAMWWLLYQYRPFLDFFTAEDKMLTITKVQMGPTTNGLMPFEFRPHGELSDASKEARRQQKLMLLQAASGPLSQFFPDGIQVLLKDIFGEFEITNRDEVLGPPWSVMQQQLQQAFQQGMQQGAEQAMEQAKQAQSSG